MRTKISVSYESLIFGGFIFLVYMLAKAPLLLGQDVELDSLKLFFILFPLLILMLGVAAMLAACKKAYACCFVLLFNILFFLNLVVGEFSSLGFFKYVSLSIFISLIALMYCILPKRHRLGEVLLTFAALLALYGVLAVLWGVVKGQQFSLRESIGINGPIIFGQLMITAGAIFILYGNRRYMLAAMSAALSLLSFSKGPIVAGLVVIFLKRKILFIALAIVLMLLFMLLPGDMLDNRIVSFVKSIYAAISNDDYDSLFSGANYGSIGSRLEQYILAGSLLSEFPYGIGVGKWGAFSVHEYPHNYFVEVLVEQGWLLGGASLIMVAFSYGRVRDDNLKYLFLMFLLFSMFSGSVLDNRGVYMITLLGLLYGNRFTKVSDKT